MPIPELILSSFLSLGLDLAKKGVAFLYTSREGKRILRRSIRRTSKRFKGYAPGGSRAIEGYLVIWIQTKEFKKALLFLEKGYSVELTLQEANSAFKKICVSELYEHSDTVLAFLFDQLRIELLNSTKGINYSINIVLRLLDEIRSKSEVKHDEIKSLIFETHDTLEQIKSGIGALNVTQKKALDDYLTESQNWDSYKRLLERGEFKIADVEIQKRLEKLDELYSDYPKSEEIFEDFHIELLLKKASLHTNLGNFNEAEIYYLKAKNKTIKGPYLKRLESKVLLNLNRVEEFELLITEEEISEIEIAKAELFMLKDEWEKLLEILPNETEDFRLLYLGIIGKLEGLDDQTLSKKSSELKSSIEKAASLTGEHPLHKIQVLNVSIQFLRKVTFGMLRAEGVDRYDLVKKIRNYIDQAIRACREVQYERGLSITLEYALLFYSLLEEEEAVVSTKKELLKIKEVENSSYKFDSKRGGFSRALELYNKAIDILQVSGVSQKDKIEHLLQAAFELSDNDEDEIIGSKLINFYLQVNELDKARSILSKLTNLGEHSKKLIEFMLQEKEKSIQDLLSISEEFVHEFPLSIQFRRYYSDLLLQTMIDGSDTPDDHNENLIQRLNDNTETLNALLPTDTNLISVANAHISIKEYNSAIEILRKISPETSVQITSLKMMAHCLIKMERTNEVADIYIQLSQLTNDPAYANEAVRFLIIDNKHQEAFSLSNEWLIRYPNNSGLLANNGLSIISRQGVTKEEGGIALERLEKANDLTPDLPNIYLLMSRAAKIAEKIDRYNEYQQLYWSSIPLVEVNSREDFDNLNDKISQGPVRFDLKGTEGLKAFIDRENDFKNALNTFYDNDLMSYIDAFARNGQPWKQWISWTSKAYNEYYNVDYSTAIKSPWSNFRSLDIGSKGVLLDISALLSLCVLSETDNILRKLNNDGISLFLRSNELKSLRNALIRPEDVFWDVIKTPFDELYNALQQHDLTKSYTYEEWLKNTELVPKALATDLGSHISDFGLSLSLSKSVFVLDEDDGMSEVNDELAKKLTSSNILLKSLVENGIIGEHEAEAAASKNRRFKGWRNSEIIDLPENVVFSAFSIRYWFEVGLLTLINNSWIKGGDHWPKIHLGPFGLDHIKIEAELVENDKQVSSLATKQLETFETLIEEEIVSILPDIEHRDDNDLELFESVNVNALKLLELAKARNLHLWSDDRVFGYILWRFDYPLQYQEIRNEIRNLQGRYSSVSYFTTEDLLQVIHKSDKKYAEEQGYRLVELGYRPLNFRLALNYLLNNYNYKPEIPKYKSYINTLEGFLKDENYDPKSKIDKKPLQRLFLARVVPSVLSSIFLSNTNRSEEERRKLASEIVLTMMPYVDRHRNEMKYKMASFWVSLLNELVNFKTSNLIYQNQEDDEFHAKLNEGLKWFAETLLESETEEGLRRAVLAIEDFLIDYVIELKKIFGQEDVRNKYELSDEDYREELKFIITSAVQALIQPLINSQLLEYFNPLLRRSLGHISAYPHEFKVSHSYNFTHNEDVFTDHISEEELEKNALQILIEILMGRKEYGEYLTSDLRINYRWQRLKPEEVRDDKEEFYWAEVNITMIRLILRDELHEMPEVIESIVRQLQLIDPLLGTKIQALEEKLLSTDQKVRRVGREEIAYSIIKSILFEFQRDIVHLLLKLQEIETSELDSFIAPVSGWFPKDMHPNVVEVNGKEFPRNVFYDAQFLTATYDLLYKQCLASVNSFKESIEKGGDQDFSIGSFYVSVLEEEISPFILAHRFLEFLIFCTFDEDEFLNEDIETQKTEFIKSFLTNTICSELNKNDHIKQYRSQDLKIIYSCLLRLSLFINGSQKHTSTWNIEYEDEERVKEHLLNNVLILSHRLIPVIKGRFGNNTEGLKNELVNAVNSLNIAYDKPVIFPDRFNPLIFGPHLLDQEVASILHSLTTFIKLNDNPEAVLDLIWLRGLAEPWVNSENSNADEVYEKQKEESSNVFKLKAPLSPKEAAYTLIDEINNRLKNSKNED